MLICYSNRDFLLLFCRKERFISVPSNGLHTWGVLWHRDRKCVRRKRVGQLWKGHRDHSQLPAGRPRSASASCNKCSVATTIERANTNEINNNHYWKNNHYWNNNHYSKNNHYWYNNHYWNNKHYWNNNHFWKTTTIEITTTFERTTTIAVSYTHLTLPTICSV